MLDNMVSIAIEFLSCVWLEIVMFGCAALAYLAFFGGVENKHLKEANLKAVAKVATSSRSYTRAASVANDSAIANDLAIVPLATALRKGRLEDAFSVLVQLPDVKLTAVLNETAPRLLAVAAASPDLISAAALFRDLVKDMEPRILEVAVEVAVLDAHKRKNTCLCGQLDAIAGLLSIPKSQITLTTLANSYIGNIKALRNLVHAADVPFTKAFAKAALKSCAAASDLELVMDILERVEPMDKGAVAAYADHHARSTSQTHLQMTSAAAVGRIRNCGRNRDLEGAVAAFGSTPLQGGRNRVQLFSSIVVACVDCGKWNLAKQYLLRAQHHRVPVDLPNTSVLVKGLLAAAETSSVEQMLQDAPTLGLPVCAACYHLLLNKYVVAGNRQAAWCLVAKMRNAGVEHSMVSCSILLKMMNSQAHAEDLKRVIDLVNTMGTPIDNILLCSITDACIKTGQLNLFADFEDRFSSRQEGLIPLEMPLYGSLIKAFGQAGEMQRVWRLWEDIQAKGLTPTEVTLGCMIESLVANSQAEAAWKLVQEIWQDQGRRHLVNTVTYATLLKGFSTHPGRVEALYQEMKERAIQCNLITYNTILNICVRGRLMHRMPSILDDMKSATPPVEPDLVTYSTLIKGFCAWGHLDHALGLLEEMQMGGTFKPDEMMYNSLLDGCAREERLSDGMRLVAEMRRDGITPSNYTLSMLVKLCGRCKKLNEAFSIVAELSAEFDLSPNIQVYTCLIQGCFQNRMPVKALSVLDTMFANGVRPDEKAYMALVRGHLNMGLLDKAIEVVERAYQGESPGVSPDCLREVIAKLGKKSEAAAALRTKVHAVVQAEQWTRDHQVRASTRDKASRGVTGKGSDLPKYAPLKPTRRTWEW